MSPFLEQRLNLSRQTLYAWQQQEPGGRLQDLLAMVHEEVKILDGLRREHPDYEESISALIDAYSTLTDGLKRKAN